MSIPHRCRCCRARQTFAKDWREYTTHKRKCWNCGSTAFSVDRYRWLKEGKKNKCICDGYWFPHRAGSKFCAHSTNPPSDEDELLRVVRG